MNDRNRCAPVALPGDEPIAQPVVDGFLTGPPLGEHLDDGSDRLVLVQSIQRTGVHVRSVVGGRLPGDRWILTSIHHDPDREVEGASKVEVTLIVSWHSHDRARAVVGQHVIRRPHGNALPIDRVDGVALQKHTGLGSRGIQAIHFRCLLDLVEVLRELRLRRALSRQLRCQIGIRSDDEERRAVEGVRPRRIHGDGLLATFDLEVHFGAGGSADPVALHQQHLLRPLTLELLHVVEEAIGVVGDLQIPLRQLLLGDVRVAPFA